MSEQTLYGNVGTSIGFSLDNALLVSSNGTGKTEKLHVERLLLIFNCGNSLGDRVFQHSHFGSISCADPISYGCILAVYGEAGFVRRIVVWLYRCYYCSRKYLCRSP
jgi:hypothetical protein